MIEIILDTETTGMDPATGDRLVEIGCVEVMNFIPTGRTYHQYINPERDVPAEAVAVHGLTREFLKNKPTFSEIYTEFLEFVGAAPLVIHNAAFDIKFLNAELSTVGHAGFNMKNVRDSLLIARKKFPGSPASLDALCRRFNIDNTGRELHGALLDAQLLAEVYLELMGGRQHGLGLGTQSQAMVAAAQAGGDYTPVSTQAGRSRVARAPRVHQPSAEELQLHSTLLEKLKNNLWQE